MVCVYTIFCTVKMAMYLLWRRFILNEDKSSTRFTDNEYILRTDCYIYTILSNFYCTISRNKVAEIIVRYVVVQEQDPLRDLPAAFFLQNVLQLHQQRWVILRVDSLALWKIINEEDAVLIPKNWGEKFSSGFLHSEFFGAGWAAMPPLIDCCFVSGS
jgi:hypothetical protein